jgi:succinoglycan biosynthesis transport protein ExoP
VSEEHRIEIYEPATAALERRRGGTLALREAGEAQERADLRAYARILRKHRWTVFSIVLVVFTVVLIATLKEKPIYRAQGMLEIEKENPNILTVQELFQLENVSDNYLETQYKVLQSESLARRVIAELHLDQKEEFNPQRSWWFRGKTAKAADRARLPVDADAEQAVLRRFEDGLSINPVRRSRLVQVSFDSEDPQLAAQVVNVFTSNYIQQNLESRWEATQKASEWLSQQLQSLKIKLEKSEDEMQQYAQSNGLLFLDSEKGTTENIVDERLRQLQDELTKAQADRYEKESVYRLVQSGDYGSLPGVVDNKLMQDLTLRLSDLESGYAQLATTFSPDYPKLKQIQNQIDDVKAVLTRERKRVAERITNDYIAAVRREGLVAQAFDAQQKQANQTAARAVQYNILKREVDTNKQLYDGLLGRLKEAGVSAGLKASNIRIVDPAVPPTKPVKPRVLLNMTLALAAGLACAIGVAFLQEHLDNTLKTSEDVEHFLQLPALAMIPAVESLNGHRRGVYGLYGRPKPPEVTLGKPLAHVAPWYRIDETSPECSMLSEAFRSLRTSVLLSSAGRPPRTLLVTSAQPAEGKTTVSTNLAISLAQLGQRVLLIDGDLRRPNIHRAFQLPPSAGLVGYLTGQQDWTASVMPTPVSGLEVIPCGPVPPNPAELLSSDRMRVLLRQATAQYNTVIADSPPLLNVSDSRVLATQVEGVVLVVKGNFTPRELAQRARGYIRDVGASLIGVVLNNIDVRRGDYSYYRYYHYDGYGRDGERGGEKES